MNAKHEIFEQMQRVHTAEKVVALETAKLALMEAEVAMGEPLGCGYGCGEFDADSECPVHGIWADSEPHGSISPALRSYVARTHGPDSTPGTGLARPEVGGFLDGELLHNGDEAESRD